MFWQVPGGIIRDMQALSLFVAWGILPAPPSPLADVTTFQVVGDSITSWEGLELSGASRVDASWIDAATGNDTLFLGGWARGGAESADMFANMPDVTADVFVILAGANDVRHGVPQGNTLSYVQMMGALAPGAVVLVAIPPSELQAPQVDALNEQLAALAEANTWAFVDPWITLRDQDGGWIVGASPDGIHPGRLAADRVGAILQNVILHRGAS